MLAIALSAVLLTAPCLTTGFVMDDFVLAVKAGHSAPVRGLPVDPLWLFTFTTGDPARNRLLIEEGVLLPWWTEPAHLNAFFRPLSALTHLLDFRLWPSSAAAMHAHSLFWFAALLLSLGYVYRRVDPSAAQAGFALLLFAIDDAHGATVGWIANRNALICLALGLPALATHHLWASGRSRVAAWLGPLFLAAGLCAGETAISLLGYLIAYAVCVDARPVRTRVLSLMPYLVLLIAHRVLSHELGLGSFGSSAYHEPLREPIAFARALGYNLPVLLSAQLFLPVADLAFWGEVRAHGYLWVWAAITLSALAWLAWPLLRRDRHARFWALGMLLAAVPVSASLPGERLLLAVGVGGSALLARLMVALYQQAHAALRPGAPAFEGVVVPLWHVPVQMHALRVLAALHLLAAPFTLPMRALALEPLAKLSDRMNETLPTKPPFAPTFVIVNAPINALLSYLQVARAVRGTPRPEHFYWLSSSSSDTYVSRIGVHTLRVEQERGFLLRPEETHYRADVHSLPVGTTVALSGMEARVAESTPDGRPKVVDFTFAEPLGSPDLVFGYYEDGDLIPLELPAPDERVRFPAQDFFKTVLEEVVR